ECMGMGIPTIMSVPEGEATTIIRETGSGIVVESENVEQIADAILRMKNDKELYESIRAKSVDSAHKYSRDL
ncbi:hypothetical protein CGG86_22830, partial [Vibrio parahaemolyticus]